MPDAALLNILKSTCDRFIVDSFDTTDGFPCLVIERNNIVPLCAQLKRHSDLQFNFLSDICVVDFLPKIPRFEVLYHLYSIPYKYRLRLKCPFTEGQEIPSVTTVWRAANWHEREAYDMYGIVFSDHPDLRRIFMWDEFEGYPQRKDFPLRGYRDEYNPFGEEPDWSEDQDWSH